MEAISILDGKEIANVLNLQRHRLFADIEEARKRADGGSFLLEQMRGEKLGRNKKFGSANIGFAIERGNLPAGALALRRMAHDEMPDFMRERKALPMRMMVAVHADQFVPRAEQAGEQFGCRMNANHLKAKMLGNTLDSYRRNKRLNAILEERVLS